MKRVIICLLAAAALTVSARAAEVPEELTEALPRGAEELLEDADFSGVQGFSGGVDRILEAVSGQVGTVLRQRVKGAASVLLVVVLCGAVDGFSQSAGGRTAFLPMVGALSVTMATAGSLDTLIGLGAETIDQLHLFSQALLPTLAAATAASGAVTTAAFHQVAAVFAADLLLQLIDGLLLPLVYLYIGVLTAASCLPENRLGVLAEGLKKGISWLLTAGLLLFTGYLSMARVVSGTVDGAAVKLTKAAISGAVPVVGGVISEAAETVLAGAGMLKSTVGLFGMLAILAACAYPFLQLGIQYLLYKLTAALAAVVGAPGLCKLIDGLGGAFGLVLGMTGSCALVLLISIISSVAAVMP